MVDAVHLFLVDDVLEGGVEFARGRQVGTERLFDDDAGTVGEALGGQHADHRLHGLRGHRQVDDGLRVGTESVPGGAHRRGQVATVVRIGCLEGDARQQNRQDLGVDAIDAVAQAGTDRIPELVIAARRMPAGADHRVLLGESVGGRQPVQPGKQFSGRQVAGGAEQHEHLWGNAHTAGPNRCTAY